MERTLLLNASYEPMKLISWKKAITLFFLGKVEIVAEYERALHSVSKSMKLPAVIRLNHYSRWQKKRVKFSRETIFMRDQYTCQYCHQTLHFQQLTCDHVVPKSLGGKSSWTNVVTACLRCNLKKSNKPLEKSGFRLNHKPREPEWHQFLLINIEPNLMHPSWSHYLISKEN